ncbi:hypothetical protein QYE76_025138 [Lolium multiflorum]|uniref:Reverse transcriptase Ty1/copia-type domain-containing protein n=1 Tax=Lolium multiflorum TaxID=4521 RepID=A0AAD8RF27_LOLMU|nr:hypothetical protein QYE76_025138 [Lolium multiflorum]
MRMAEAYGRLGALRVKVKGLGCEKYNDGFEMNEEFIKSKVITMIAVKQKDTNLALNLGRNEEKEARVAGLAYSEPGSLFTYDYSKDYSMKSSTPNDICSSFMARITHDDDFDDTSSSMIVGSCIMAREAKIMESPPSLSSILDNETVDQDEEVVLKELFKVRCTLRGDALVKFDFLMDSFKERDDSIEELEYHMKDEKRRFNLLRQELKNERCISQGLKQLVETFELDKVKDQETIERAQLMAQELDASKKELEVAHASLTKDLDHLEKANKLVKDELKKLGENHDLLQDTYKKALGSLNDPIVAKNVASSSTSFTCEHAKLVEEHVRLKEEISLYVETNVYLESLVTKYGLNYYPNDSACEQATILEENARLTKELAKFTTSKNKMGLDDLLSKQRSNNQKYGLGYAPKPYKKNNYKKEKPAQEKNKKVTNDGKAPKGKATSGDRTGPNNHYALFDYYGDVYAKYVGPRMAMLIEGFQVRQLAKGTFISQEKYVKDMLKKFNMTNASPMKTPMPVKGQLGSCDGEKDVDIKTEKLKLGSPEIPEEGSSKKRRAANVGHFQPDVGSDQFLRILFRPTFGRLRIPQDFVRWFGEIPSNIIVTTNTGCN